MIVIYRSKCITITPSIIISIDNVICVHISTTPSITTTITIITTTTTTTTTTSVTLYYTEDAVMSMY